MSRPIDELLQYGADNPVKFLDEMWPGAEECQRAVFRAVHSHRRTAVVSCNGAGKTWIGARIIAWFLLTHPGSIVVTTAGTWTQVRRQLWKEISIAYARLPECLQLPKLNTTDWTLTPEWYAIGISTNDEHFFEGFHARYVLVVVDEGKSVQQGIFDAINRIFAGKSDMVRLLVISSPGNAEGPHYEAFHSKADMYCRVKISPFESWMEPPKGERVDLPCTKHLTEEYIDEMKREYGEDSPLYKSMVLAEWSEDIAFRLFPPSVLRDSRDPCDIPKGATVKVGADVARSTDGDECVFIAVYRWEQPDGVHYAFKDMEAFNTADSGEFEDRLRTFCAKNEAESGAVNVDGSGLGGPVCDHLNRSGFRVNEIQFGGGPTIETPLLANMRAELWWTGATIARQGRLHGVNDNRLSAQLSTPFYSYDSRGRILIESKEAMARRMVKERPRSPWRSPDRADALLLALHEGEAPAIPLSSALNVYR